MWAVFLSLMCVTDIPVLYYYDIDADTVYYCGFYSGKLNKNAYYDGFRPDQQLMIIKDT